MRRVRLVEKLLKQFDFRIDVKEDSLFARLQGYDKDYINERLRILGHIIIHTRQLDMGMSSNARANWYYEDILKGIRSFVNIPH